MVTATMLTEAAGPLAARDYPTLRAHAGAAPVTKRSGKRAFRPHAIRLQAGGCAKRCITGRGQHPT